MSHDVTSSNETPLLSEDANLLRFLLISEVCQDSFTPASQKQFREAFIQLETVCMEQLSKSTKIENKLTVDIKEKSTNAASDNKNELMESDSSTDVSCEFKTQPPSKAQKTKEENKTMDDKIDRAGCCRGKACSICKEYN